MEKGAETTEVLNFVPDWRVSVVYAVRVTVVERGDGWSMFVHPMAASMEGLTQSQIMLSKTLIQPVSLAPGPPCGGSV
jgi:hypothetical protein